MEKLFAKTNLEEYFVTQKKKIIKKIKSKDLPPNTDANEFANIILEQRRIKPIKLQLSESHTNYKQLTLDKDKYFVRVRIPYTGDKQLLNLYPAAYKYSELPNGRAGYELIVLHFIIDISTPKTENERVFQMAIDNLKKLVEIVNKEVISHNSWMDVEVLTLVENKIEKAN